MTDAREAAQAAVDITKAAEAAAEAVLASVAPTVVTAEAVKAAAAVADGSVYLGHIGEPRIEGKDY